MADWRNVGAYQSAYLSGGVDMKPGEKFSTTILAAELQELGKGDKAETKLVLGLKGSPKDKAFVLNKTNAKAIQEITRTADYDQWIGKKIALKCVTLEISGDETDVLRVIRPEDGMREWGAPAPIQQELPKAESKPEPSKSQEDVNPPAAESKAEAEAGPEEKK